MLQLWQLGKAELVRRGVALLLTITAVSIGGFSQCAKGIVAVQGSVENLVAGVRDVNVKVVLQTPKGDFSKTAAVTNGQFSVEVPFDTLKSWSGLSGHHCSNSPRLVDVTVKTGERVLGQKVLDFKQAFEIRALHVYRLKHQLVLAATE